MRYAGGGVGHYPLRIEDSPQESPSPEADEEVTPVPTPTALQDEASGSESEGMESEDNESGGSASEEDVEDILGDAEGEFAPDEDDGYE